MGDQQNRRHGEGEHQPSLATGPGAAPPGDPGTDDGHGQQGPQGHGKHGQGQVGVIQGELAFDLGQADAPHRIGEAAGKKQSGVCQPGGGQGIGAGRGTGG